MDGKVLDFLKKEGVCSLTILLKDGSPHAAAMHYSHEDNPLILYFSTENTSRKCQALLDGRFVKGTVVVGFSEKEWISLQMDGRIKVISNKKELTSVRKIHYAKHPDSEKYKDDPATIFLAFTPTWWRYTEFKSDPMVIISSEDK